MGNATPALPSSVALAMTDGMFRCNASVQSRDADGQALSAQYRCRANGQLVDETFADALAVGSFVRGTKVQCEVAASDVETASEYVASEAMERPNLSPSAPASVVLSLTSQLRCVASGATDQDSDAISYGYQWLKNGTVLHAETTATFSGIRTKGDSFVCKARASDAAVASAWVSSDSVVIPNAAPTGPTSVTLSPIIAYR